MKWAAGLIDAFQPADGPPPKTLWDFMKWSLRGSFGVIAAGSAISMIAGAMEVSSALLLGYLVDVMFVSETRNIFSENWSILAMIAGFFLILRPIFFGLSSAVNSITIAPNINPLVLQRLNRHTLGQAISFFDDDFAGRIAQKQMQTARAVTDVVVESVNVIAFALATLAGTVLLLASIDPKVTAVLAVWLICFFLLISWFLPRVRARATARAGSRAMVSGQIVDTLTNIKTVKLFAHAKHEDQATLDALGVFREKSLSYGYMATLFRFSMMAMAGILPVLLLGATLWLWKSGGATSGDIVAASSVAIRIAQMTGWVSFTLMTVYSNIGEIEDGMRTLTPSHRVTDVHDATELANAAGQVEFRDVIYTYGQGPGGLRGVSLTVKPGEKLGLVGASGAGKSTLVALLMRLYDIEDGRISVDDYDIRDLSQESLRRQIGMVTQETAMFNRSARDNIMYGRPDATEAQMITAAKRSEAHAFILDLKDHRGRTGYDAYLGENGVKLSGGQRQRIAIARAILKDAPVLVLDEATSALDSEIEAAIQDTLHHVMEGKTVIAIAHRLSTIARMDRIIVLEDGRIAEQGTHNQLLAANGLYARFWDRQSGGFIGIQSVAE